MKKGLLIADWLFYSNVWIALNAAAQVMQTRFLLGGGLELTPAAGFIFFGTLFLYAIHRIIGVGQLAPFTASGRYKVISEHKKHLFFFSVLGLVGGLYFFFLLPWQIQWKLVLPGLLALGYVLPLGASGKRLRDLHFLKIFLLALVWAWLTVWLPAAELGADMQRATLLMGVERAAFIFALVVPFDIRDVEVDRHVRVRTLPNYLGVNAAIALAFLMMAAMLAFAWVNHYPAGARAGLACSAGITMTLVLLSRQVQHDYFFSGLLDGMLGLQFLLVLVGVKLYL